MKNKKNLFLLLACCAVVSFYSCKKDTLKAAPTKVFKVALFKENLKNQLASARGFQFVITQDKKIADSAAVGMGGQDATGASTTASINGYMNIASVTKTLTAITALKLLALNGLTVDSTIGRWLPNSWPKNPSIANLRFKDLLTHKSGITESSTTWASLKQVVANPPSGTTDYFYANVNFALFRAMIPKLENPSVFNFQETNVPLDHFELWMSDRYIDRVNHYVISKAELSTKACTAPSAVIFTMMNEAPETLISQAHGDWKALCGGGGFFMSIRDLAKLMVFMRYTNSMLTDEERALMDDNLYGWNRKVPVFGGNAFGHGGALYNDADGSGDLTAVDPGLQTLIMKFPNNVELSLGINSVGNTWRNTSVIVQESYNQAWVVE